MIGFAVGFACASLCLAVAACVVSAWCLIDVQAFRRSTHQVQYVPVDDVMAKKADQEINKQYTDIANQSWDNLGKVDPEDQNI